MDGLNAQFGRLSTSAAEWKPPSASASRGQPETTTQPSSDLSASTVKEFVPGQGWAAAGGVGGVSPEVAPGGDQSETPSSDPYAADETSSTPFSTFPAGSLPSPMPSFRSINSIGVSDDTWESMRELSLESLRQMHPSDERHKEVISPYCNGYCLDNEAKLSQRSSFGYPCKTFQVTSREDGNLYCLRRFDDVRCVSPKIAATIEDRWTRVRRVQEHPGIVPLYRCFLAQRAVFFVHQYIPGARTLKERLGGQPLSEPVLWSCIVQLVSAIRTIHSNNLAARSIDTTHIISNTDATASRLRLRLNCAGIVDALEFEARRHVRDLQVQDIIDLGWLILSLATGTEVNAKSSRNTIIQCENFLSQNFSMELRNLCMTLIRGSPQPPSIMDVSRAITQHVYDEQETAYKSLDLTERLLSSEYESGRALRLLLKLGFINERPEFRADRSWSQSGELLLVVGLVTTLLWERHLIRLHLGRRQLRIDAVSRLCLSPSGWGW